MPTWRNSMSSHNPCCSDLLACVSQALSILSSVLKWYKVASMVFIKAILIPLFMGMVLNVVTLKTCNTTLEDRVLRCQQVSGRILRCTFSQPCKD